MYLLKVKQGDNFWPALIPKSENEKVHDSFGSTIYPLTRRNIVCLGLSEFLAHNSVPWPPLLRGFLPPFPSVRFCPCGG